MQVRQEGQYDVYWDFDRDVTFSGETCSQLQVQRQSGGGLMSPYGVVQTAPRRIECSYEYVIQINGRWAIQTQPEGFTPADAVDVPQAGSMTT